MKEGKINEIKKWKILPNLAPRMVIFYLKGGGFNVHLKKVLQQNLVRNVFNL